MFGLVVTGGSIFVQTAATVEPFLNVFIVVGVMLLLVSTALAGITYTSSNLRGGLDTAAIERATAAEAEGQRAEFEKQLRRSYARWIAYNARMTAVNDMLATVTVLLSSRSSTSASDSRSLFPSSSSRRSCSAG